MKVVLIGSGNLAHHLGHAFYKKGITIQQVMGRSASSAKKLSRSLHCAWSIDSSRLDLSADLYLLAVSDHELPAAISEFPLLKDKVVVHTSGTVPLSVFPRSFKHAGVFWPVQTLTKKEALTNNRFPVCIEYRSTIARTRMRKLAKSIECKSVELKSSDRELLHLSAVMVNNFTNHLYTLAEELLRKKKID
ncbi:MAG: DUF2520 domain-containing protein, partial [Bacteroidota bacterium]